MPRGKFICNECRTGKVVRERSSSKEGLSFKFFRKKSFIGDTFFCGNTGLIPTDIEIGALWSLPSKKLK